MTSGKPRSGTRIAMVQMLVEGGQPESNLERAVARIEEAAGNGTHVAVLPECLDLGWTDPGARELAEPVPGARFEALARAAAEAGVHVVAGLVERAGDKLYNAAVLIGPSGELLGLHRKINELPMARDLYAVGDRLGVVDTELGRVGLLICADNLPDSLVLGHSLGRMGAGLILSPSAWAVDAGHDNLREPYEGFWLEPYRELALANGMVVVGVSGVGTMNAGPWRGRKMIGCSLAVGADGRVLAQAPYGVDADCISYVDL